METKQFRTKVGEEELVLEVSSMAEQANAAVLARYGETIVLATAVMSKRDVELPYFPLRVDYEERFYAAGKILGSRFVRREGRPSDDATLSCRLVDRVLRPLFDNRMRRDIQVVVTVLSYDEEHDPDFPGLMGASLALAMSDIPWDGPVGGVRVAKIGDKVVINPSNSQIKEGAARADGFMAGPKGFINMIELGGSDVPEEDVLALAAEAQKVIDDLVVFQDNIVKEIGKEKSEVTLSGTDEGLAEKVRLFIKDRLEDTVYPHLSGKDLGDKLEKTEREERLQALLEELKAHLAETSEEGGAPEERSVEFLFEKEVDALVHKNILEKELRPDGRKLDEVRSLESRVGLFARTHGSAFFVRGNTQALAVVTLAPPGSAQMVETMEVTGTRQFMLHYNFPPFSVGETGPFRSPGRREIGHGALASKAIEPLIPSTETFPYTIRIVSEILSSNGSSSMATVCASSLALMDAGVPISKPAAGIAMGLMSDGKGNWKVLTDIQGPEDHYGDMDFKVAGTEDGVNAVQLDVKVGGITPDIIKQTLVQARDARIHILKSMKAVCPGPRESISQYAPTVLPWKIDPSKIGLVIGSGGKTINGLIEKYALAGIDVEEDGRLFVSSSDRTKAQAALEEIKNLTRDLEVGEVVEGPIVKILDFGAIVDLGGGKDGMLHVSELKDGFVEKVTDVVKKGDIVKVKVVRVDPDGRIGLSLKQMEA